jgi:glycosyltransferase involved in cell wall biosynthesis
MPIEWPEPFGLVMIEALATGTPVITFERGAAAEIVIDGENGFLVSDVAGMVAAIDRLHEIDPVDCRGSVERFDVATVCAPTRASTRTPSRAPLGDQPRRPVIPALRQTSPFT